VCSCRTGGARNNPVELYKLVKMSGIAVKNEPSLLACFEVALKYTLSFCLDPFRKSS